MPKTPPFFYYLAGKDSAVNPGSGIWYSRLPNSRKGDPSAAGGLTYGDYFTAVSDVLAREGRRFVQLARSGFPGETGAVAEIVKGEIFLEKHGAFYHPSRVILSTEKDRVQLVVNAALSPVGKEILKKEFAYLASLYEITSEPRLPRVYWSGEGRFAPKGSVGMFVGEWLDGYHEFHWTRDPADSRQKLVVWDHENTPLFLDEARTRELFRQASCILTELYNPQTFQQIYPWHHASGDFVVQLQPRGVHVKLVTVRQYEPIIRPEETVDIEMMLQAMLLFFFNLTIRMRIDRLNGAAEMVWCDDIAAKGAVLGFLDGLKILAKHYPDLGARGSRFIDFFGSWTVPELQELVEPLAVLYSLEEAEVALIAASLPEHVRLMDKGFRRLAIADTEI
jgi:hypothetical protein